DPERLRYLAGLGIRPGVTVAVLEVLPFDGPLRVRVGVGGDECMVGRPLAAAVYVAGSEPSEPLAAAATDQ
nr:ferrous iron transport protein A [Chloroflexia bacterium]